MSRRTQFMVVLIAVTAFVTAMWQGGLADDCEQRCKKVQAWYTSSHADDDCRAWENKTCYWAVYATAPLWVMDGASHDYTCEKVAPQEENTRYDCVGNCTHICADHERSEKTPPTDFQTACTEYMPQYPDTCFCEYNPQGSE